MKKTVAKIAVSAATFQIDKPYDYLIPSGFIDLAKPGMRVLVPFGIGNKEREGVILSIVANSKYDSLKEVISIVDEASLLSTENLKLALWMSDRFFCTVYDALRTMLPAKMSPKRKSGSIETKKAYDSYVQLSTEQSEVFKELLVLLKNNSPEAALLYGITGSGKTLIYIKLIEETLSLGKTAIVLVPEIALTPQTVRIFQSHFGNDVAVLHSALGTGQRYDEWKRIKDGDVHVVIGTRSAVFAPLTNIGLIVIDEEQEHTYKSDKSPRYHTR